MEVQMKHESKLVVVAAIGILVGMGTAFAQYRDRDQVQTQPPDQVRTQDQLRDRDIYGYQMMTEQERNEYRARMLGANTQEERDRIRAEHHALILARAKERGMTLPAQPGMGGPEIPMPGPGMMRGGGRR